MNKITYCIPSKNNLRYLKNSILSIKENTSSDIIVFIDSDDDGTSNWLKTNGINFIKNYDSKIKGIAYGYNRCIEESNTDIVCMFHADMYMGKGFENGCLKYLKEKTIVSATRIEPPLHPPGKEKIVQHFGFYPEDFKKEEFNLFIEKYVAQQEITNGIFAPWMCYKKDIVEIGMHDEKFHSYHEDSDIFQRFILNGCKTIQSWSAFVYHLTCRGGQFQDGIDKITTDLEFHKMKYRSFRHFMRKWGCTIRNDDLLHPIMPHKYNIGFIIHNIEAPSINHKLFSLLEPICSNIYSSENPVEYIKDEQPHCFYDLQTKFKKLTDEKINDIIVSFDVKKLTNNNVQFLINTLPDIIHQTNDIGEFEYDIFRIEIKNINPLEKTMIHV